MAPKLTRKPNPRLTADGAEVLSGKPRVVVLERQRSISELLAMSTDRGYNNLDFGEEDDVENDFDFEADEISQNPLPDSTPFQEGFVDSMGPSESQVLKRLQKSNPTLYKQLLDAPDSPSSPPASNKQKSAPAPSKAGGRANSEPDAGEEDPAQ